jgi:hypothetical protein
VTMFTLQTSFKLLLLKEGGGGGEVNPSVEVTEDFCPNYVQEFGLSIRSIRTLLGHTKHRSL